jgi:ABC-type sugar transport system substrate-binding protein
MRSQAERLADGSRVGVLSCFILVAAIMGCERVPPPGSGTIPSEGDLVVLIGPARPNPRWVGIAGGARLFMQDYPQLRLKSAAPSDNSALTLSRIIDAALNDNPRAICLFVRDPVVARPAIDKILAQTTIVVTMGVDTKVPGVFGHVHLDMPAGAELLAEHLSEIAAGKRSYVLLHYYGTTPTGTRCYERFMRRMRAQPGLTLLEERNAGEAEQPPAELVRAMFARFRHAGLAVTLDPGPWLSASPAELLGGEARFATLGAPRALWPYLRSGEAAALVGSLDGEIGSLAVELALAGITERFTPGQVRIVDSELVTPENLDGFARRYAAAAGFELSELMPRRVPKPSGSKANP